MNADMFDYLANRFNTSSSSLRSSLKSQLDEIFTQLTKKSAIKDNLYLFTETFLSAVLVTEQKDSDTLQFLKEIIEKKIDTKGLLEV